MHFSKSNLKEMVRPIILKYLNEDHRIRRDPLDIGDWIDPRMQGTLTFSDMKIIADLLTKGFTPEHIANSSLGKKHELTIEDIEGIRKAHERGLLEAKSKKDSPFKFKIASIDKLWKLNKNLGVWESSLDAEDAYKALNNEDDPVWDMIDEDPLIEYDLKSVEHWIEKLMPYVGKEDGIPKHWAISIHRNGEIEDGFHRLAAAKYLNLQKYPVQYWELNEAPQKRSDRKKKFLRIKGDLEPFDLEKLNSLKTYEERKYYLKTRRNTKFLGEGSSRIVYKIGDDVVLKLGDGPKGSAQNRAEVMAVWCGMQKYYAEIYNHAKDFSWVVVEMAKPISSKAFENMLGFSLKNLKYALSFAKDIFEKLPWEETLEEEEEAFKKLNKNSWFRGLAKMIVACGLEPGDIAKPNSWGIAEDGRPILIDYGLSSDIYDIHYT